MSFLRSMPEDGQTPEAVALKNTTSEDIAKAVTEVFARMGFPEEVLTDRGSKGLTAR